jgi:hypothetical protein
MNIQGQRPGLEIKLIGEAALRVLSTARHGTVLASVSNAVYLLNQRDELCWLIPMDAPMHRRALKTAAQPPRFNVGSKYQAVDHTLTINSNATLDFRQSGMWKEPKIPKKGTIPISRLSDTVNLLAEKLLALNCPAGFGCLIKPILQLAVQQNNFPASFENSIAEKAWPEVNGLIQAFQRKDDELFIHSVKSLVGLGEGLTPSGDDFLGGFFFSRWLLSHYYPDILIDEPFSTYSDFITQSKPLTNQISYTFLKDHLDGHSIEPLHQLANGLLQGEISESLILHAERLISLGHTTGWDLLTGFLAGMSVSLHPS